MTCRQLSRIQKFRKWRRKQWHIEDHNVQDNYVEDNYVEDKELEENTVEDIKYLQYFFENVINFITDLNDNLF